MRPEARKKILPAKIKHENGLVIASIIKHKAAKPMVRAEDKAACPVS
jgi:hypothetical protein